MKKIFTIRSPLQKFFRMSPPPKNDGLNWAARTLGLSHSRYVWQWIAEGKIPSPVQTDEGKWHFSRESQEKIRIFASKNPVLTDKMKEKLERRRAEVESAKKRRDKELELEERRVRIEEKRLDLERSKLESRFAAKERDLEIERVRTHARVMEATLGTVRVRSVDPMPSTKESDS